jgi:hypothetical protein
MLPWNRPEFIGSLRGTCLKSTFRCSWRMRSTSRQSGSQDRHEGLSVDCRVAQAWSFARQLRSAVLIRDLRDLTRTRATLSQEQSSVGSRIQKILDSANIKLSSTASNTMGKSERAMLDTIVSGEDSAERLAELALGKLRSKIPQLQLALEGCIRDHHRSLLDSLLRQFRFAGWVGAVPNRSETISEEIDSEAMAPTTMPRTAMRRV